MATGSTTEGLQFESPKGQEFSLVVQEARGSVVVKALCCKPEGGFFELT
jgi:hypothetical protein